MPAEMWHPMVGLLSLESLHGRMILIGYQAMSALRYVIYGIIK